MDADEYINVLKLRYEHRKEKARCYLYLIESTSGHIKIGISKNPIKRLEQLRATQGPYYYDLIDMYPHVSRKSAMEAEMDFHNIFTRKRVNGEWFTLTTSDLLYIGGEVSMHNELFRKGIDLHEYYKVPEGV